MKHLAFSVVALFGLSLLGACLESEDDPPFDSTPATSTPSASANEEPIPAETQAAPKVSLVTSCSLLIPASGGGPMQDIQLLMGSRSLSAKDVEKIEEGLDSLATISETAQPALAGQLEALAGQAELFLADAYDPDAPARDTTPYKAAGLEVANICLEIL